MINDDKFNIHYLFLLVSGKCVYPAILSDFMH